MDGKDLLMWGRRGADPWNRLGSLSKPLIVLVEFCQVEGPRPLFAVDSNGEKPVADLDAIAVWLMSSEAAVGSIILLYNQQMALHALVYHTTMYDISGRAFQRPLCVGYLFTDRPSSSFVSRFTSKISMLMAPLINCNRVLFIKLVHFLISISNEAHNQLVHEYYSIYHPLSGDASKKVQALAEQARRLSPLLEMLKVSRGDNGECSGHEEVHLPEWVTSCNSSPVAIQHLAPCTFSLFLRSLLPFLRWMTAAENQKAVLFSSNSPVLRLPKSETPLKECLRGGEELRRENSLLACRVYLDQILFPVLAGDNLTIRGGVHRLPLIQDLVSELEYIRPKSNINRTIDTTSTNDGMSVFMGVPGKAASVVLDLNACTLRGYPYTGDFLSKMSVSHRMSETALRAYLVSQLTRSCQLVYLCWYLNMDDIVREEKLSSADRRIITALLSEGDWTRFSNIRKESLEGSPMKVIHLQ